MTNPALDEEREIVSRFFREALRVLDASNRSLLDRFPELLARKE